MARRPAPPPKPESPILTVEQKRRRIERLQKCIRDLEAFDPQKVQKRYGVPEVLALEAAIDEALSAAFGHGTAAYGRYNRAAKLDHGPHIARVASTFGRGPQVNYAALEAQSARQYFTDGKQQSIVLLQQAIRTLEDEIADDQTLSAAPARPTLWRTSSKVFVVHGHDEAALQAAARFLEQLDLEAIILREQPDAGRTVIEKFEDCASEVGFAIVLLTPDDLAGPASGPAAGAQARQNVIFELGYFAGKLGRGRTCLLRKGDVDIPSDLYGVIYTDIDAADGWKIKLVRELKAAKLDFDANRMWT
jgi:predicted nucleotide-binding protein